MTASWGALYQQVNILRRPKIGHVQVGAGGRNGVDLDRSHGIEDR